MKLLIIEDEEVLVRVLEEKFRKEGLEVVVVNSGDLAVETARKFKPDIILLDIVLPHKDGFEILTELKADHELKDISVIIMSNIDEDQRVEEALKMGAVDYIMKVQHPINEIVDRVMQHSIQPQKSL